MEKQSTSPQETRDFAWELKAKYPDTKLWLLYGDLGSGKTTFVQGLLPAAKSPTFTLLNAHDDLIHGDFYRLNAYDPILQETLLEAIAEGKHLVLEWPEHFESHFNVPHLKIRFSHASEGERHIESSHHS